MSQPSSQQPFARPTVRTLSRTRLALAYLQLGRVPNVFTALADVLLGWFLVTPAAAPSATLFALLTASACLYTAGMVLNDVFDAEVDARERPGRPIPSRRVAYATALRLGMGLLVAGVAAGWLAAFFERSWAPGLVATCLAGVVFAYDRGVKFTLAGPVAMGACRGLNLLLGASPGAAQWSDPHWLIAGGLTIYVTGITLFARQEAERSRRQGLVFGLAVMLSGIAVLACLPLVVAAEARTAVSEQRWWLLLGLMAAPIVLRCALAVAQPDSRHVIMAVKTSIVSLILLDATLCVWTRGFGPALVIAVLVFPTLSLGRWVYST